MALAIVAAVAVLGSVIWLAVTWQSRGPLTAAVALSNSGNEILELYCDGCLDGTVATLGAHSAQFVGNRATLPLSVPLKVGDNPLMVSLTRLGAAPENVSLLVPVLYRVRPDFSGLQKYPPVVTIQVEAVTDTAVVLDGKPVELDAAGRDQIEIELSQDVTGPATRVERLERRIPYTITPPDSEPQHGTVTLQVGIVPLQVDAPGESIVVQSPTFMLAGHTQKGGSVSVSGRAITVDPSGRFAQLMNVSSVGKTTIVVRATAPDHAPRLFPIEVRRVDSLSAEARSFAIQATRTYAALAGDLESKRGWAVALAGDVVEARTRNHASIILLDVVRGCPDPPCLARVVHGARVAAQTGSRITVYGRLLGSVEGPRSGSRIPNVRAQFVLAGTGP